LRIHASLDVPVKCALLKSPAIDRLLAGARARACQLRCQPASCLSWHAPHFALPIRRFGTLGTGTPVEAVVEPPDAPTGDAGVDDEPFADAAVDDEPFADEPFADAAVDDEPVVAAVVGAPPPDGSLPPADREPRRSRTTIVATTTPTRSTPMVTTRFIEPRDRE
jgi:hypothetical protein